MAHSDGIAGELVHQGLREGLLASADVELAYQLAQEFSNRINEELNVAADRKNVSVATSLLTRALTARALLLVAGDWWSDFGHGPKPAYHGALRTFLEEPPPGYVDRSAAD